MNLVFCGTPPFAVPTLNALVTAGHRISLVVTQPDRPSGRGQQSSESAVKQRAKELKLNFTQPEKLKTNSELRTRLVELNPDAIVVVAYGRIIPAWMLSLPRLGNFNVHASLLPKYRGAAPVQWAIANGEKVTGVTIIQLDEGLDTGPILLQGEVPIRDEDTALTLTPRLADLGAELMVDGLARFDRGMLKLVAQDHSQASFAPLLKKEDGLTDFSRTATEISNRLRAFQPWPGAYTYLRGRRIEITAANPVQEVSSVAQAKALVRAGRLFFSCGGGTLLEVLELKPEGKNRITGREFVNGYRLQNGESLGS